MLLICENCEVFSIPIEYVLDISCICNRTKNGNKNDYFSKEGFIKLSSDVNEIYSNDVIYYNPANEYEYESKDDYKFINRIPRYLDICYIKLITKEKRNLYINIPYAPIESFFVGCVEMTDCHSFEIDEQNNNIIKYGNLSLMPKRKELNIEDIVENWDEMFKGVGDNYININLNRFYYREVEGEITVSIIVDLEFGKKEIYPIIINFEGVTEFEEDRLDYAYSLILYQLLDGIYFAQINNMAEFKFKRCYLERLMD